jgi:hypothetical protein
MKTLLLAISMIFLFGNIYAIDILKVTVTYTAYGVTKSEDALASAIKTINRDKGTPIDIRIYKTSTAPSPSDFSYACFPTGGGNIQSSISSSVFFPNVGDALTNEIWCMVNTNEGLIKIRPVDLPTSYPDLSPVNREVDGSTSSSYKEFIVGQTVDVECDIWNNGQGDAGTHRTGFYIGTTNSDYSNRFDYNTTGSTPIKPTYAEHESSSYTFAATDIGTRYINIWADYRDVIEEGTAEGNNKQSWGPFTVKDVIQNSLISGIIQAGTDPFSKIGGLIVLATNTADATKIFSSTPSANITGAYVISEVQPGTYILSIKEATSNEYTISGPGSSAFTVTGSNVTGKDLTLTSNAVPTVRLENLPTTFSPGTSFTFRAYVKNTNYSTNTQAAYIDVSFPENPTVEILPVTSSGVITGVYATDAADAEQREIWTKAGNKITTFYKLASGHKTGIANGGEIWMDIKVTPPANATYTSMTIKYRGTIGDKHDPASGTITDQQGWSVKETVLAKTEDPLIKDWTTVNFEGIDYVVQFKANNNFNLANRIISQEYCDFVDEVAIYSIQNGQRILVEDESNLLPVLYVAANKVLLNSLNYTPERINAIVSSDIQFLKDVTDNDGNLYRLSSLLDLSNDEQMIRNTSIFNNEGTDYYDNRYKMYSDIIRSMVYYLSEEQVKNYYSSVGPILDEIDEALTVADFTAIEPLGAIEDIMLKHLKLSNAQQIINSSNDVLTINTIGNIASKIGTITSIIQSAHSFSYNRKKALVEYLFMTELTGFKIETLYESIISTSGSLKDPALVAAIKDIRWDYYQRYNAYNSGDWNLLKSYIAYDQNEADFQSTVDVSVSWGITWVKDILAASGGYYAYLALLPWNAGFSIMNSRDNYRCSIFSTNIHEILYSSIKNKTFELATKDKNLESYGTANNMRYLSAHLAYNYLNEYLNDPLVWIGSWMHYGFATLNEAVNYYKDKASRSLYYYNNSGAPWYFSGTPELAYNQTCLAGKLKTTYLETEKITPPILSVTKTSLLKNELGNMFANGAVSNQNSQLVYQFDFGDGILSSWNSSAGSHAYANAGNFIAKVKARSQKNSLIESPWSNTIEIKVTNPETISKPGVPIVSGEVKINQQFSVTSSGSTSSSVSQLDYQYNWGDGFLSSWGTIVANYKYESEGAFKIFVRARSKTNTNIVSEWSDPLEINVLALKLYGHLTYNNTSETPLNNVSITLLNSENELVGNSVSDASGDFSFSNLSDGIYTINPNITKAWGGATAMDITSYKKHIGALTLLSPLRAKSGDVNGSNSLTTMDLTIIKQRIGSQISLFPAGDWLYDIPSVTINGSDKTQNIMALCYGDANGSNVPSDSKKSITDSEVFIPGNESVKFINNLEFEVPIRLNKSVSKLASVTLIFTYPSEILDIKGIEMVANNEDLDYYVKDGTVTLIYSTLNPIDVKEGDLLMTIGFSFKAALNSELLNNFKISLSGQGEFGDFNDNVLDGIKLYFASENIITQINSEENSSISIHPNPVSDHVIITNVENSIITIYDLMGTNLLTQKSIFGQLKLSLSDFNTGTYIIKVSKNNTHVFRKILIIK